MASGHKLHILAPALVCIFVVAFLYTDGRIDGSTHLIAFPALQNVRKRQQMETGEEGILYWMLKYVHMCHLCRVTQSGQGPYVQSDMPLGNGENSRTMPRVDLDSTLICLCV